MCVGGRFFDSNSNPRIVPNSRGKKRHPKSKDLMTAVKCSDPLFIDFLQCCLHWDPKQRYKPEDALQHVRHTHICRLLASFPIQISLISPCMPQEWILEATNPTPRREPLTRCASLALAPLPLIFSYHSEKSVCGTDASRSRC